MVIKEVHVGKLRDESKWPDIYVNDPVYHSNGVNLDCPQEPAHVLLDDLEQEIVTDMGLDLDEGLYMYKIEPYPESHHV